MPDLQPDSSKPVELRCGMCDGDGENRPKPAHDCCPWCDGTGTVMAHLDGKYVKPMQYFGEVLPPTLPPPTREELFTDG